jgi:tetratricopeptide (TPR) repeat protein
MRVCVSILLALSFSGASFAQNHSTLSPARPAVLMSGLGDLQHPVSTSNAEAQQFFDQGLRLIYAFNHDEAARSFARAAEFDSKLAMAYWGIAEAVGPNYNDPASDERFSQAHRAIQTALDLSSNASPSEKAYINAMALRFPADIKADRRKAAEAYHDAMRKLVKQYPDDLDAATLFAESGMNLHPWGLWHSDGTPETGTEEIQLTLESVLRRDPNHMGAIHYYIHTVEASPNPERALAGANKLASLAPAAGHIVHMPSHVYIRTGDYEAAIKTNEEAAAADQVYIGAGGVQGIYPLMYYSHNLHFIAACASMSGDYPEAKQNADKLAAHVGPHVQEMPPIEGFMTVPMAVDVRFHRWEEILQTHQPDPAMKITTVFWHFSRGMAFAATGKIDEGEAELKIVSEAAASTPPDVVFAMPANNKAKDIMKIAMDVLGAKIAMARKDSAVAIAKLTEAVAVQDSLKYGEPPDWFFPVRESLGAALLMSGDATGAEKVFRTDLDQHPRNPRSLFGLIETLKAQGKNYDGGFVQKQFEASWKGESSTLRIGDLV